MFLKSSNVKRRRKHLAERERERGVEYWMCFYKYIARVCIFHHCGKYRRSFMDINGYFLAPCKNACVHFISIIVKCSCQEFCYTYNCSSVPKKHYQNKAPFNIWPLLPCPIIMMKLPTSTTMVEYRTHNNSKYPPQHFQWSLFSIKYDHTHLLGPLLAICRSIVFMKLKIIHENH